MTSMKHFYQAYLDLITIDSNACIALGIDEKLNELPSKSLASNQIALQQAKNLLAQLHVFEQELKYDSSDSGNGNGEVSGNDNDNDNGENTDTAKLADDQTIDLALIKLAAEQVVVDLELEINGKLNNQQLPKAGEEISSGIFLLVTNDPRPPNERLDNILSRLSQVPRYLQEYIQYLDTPVKRWVDIDVDTISGLPDFFATIQAWAVEESYEKATQLEGSIALANQAINNYIKQLTTLETTNNFIIGELQAVKILQSKGITLSLQEIHQLTCSFVEKTLTQLSSLQEKLIARYQLPAGTTIAALQDFLLAKYAVKVPDNNLAFVIERYQQEAVKIEQFVREKSLFPILENQSMRIMQTPNFMAPMIPAGAMMQPAALRAGIKTSLVYLTLSKELLAEHTELGIPVMMVHEGIPGHHLQLATACMNDSIVRKTFPAMEYAEGWTTMLEDYMLDQGYMGELTDEARFIAKLDISRISARVAIDLYFMTGNCNYLSIGYGDHFIDDDPFVNAAKLLKTVTGFTDGRVQAELNWYSQERGYPLSYLVGNHLVWQLKNDVIAAQKDKLSEKEIDTLFHQTFLNAGNMPVNMLRKVFEDQKVL